MDPRFLEHVRELSLVLDGKDPRRSKSKARGTAILMLSGQRLAIVVDSKRVSVSTTFALPDDDDSDLVIVHAAFDDWLAFYRDAGTATLAKLRIHGDVELLAAIGELLVAPRLAQDVLSGGAR